MRLLKTATMAALLVISALAVAEETDYSAIESRFRMMAPNAHTIAVSETPVPGILMVQVNGEIFYSSEDGRYLLQGRIVDMNTREDLTEMAKAGLRAELLKDVDTSRQITFAPEDPEFELMVFTDIDCGYCRKLHNQMAEYNEAGIAISYMAFPRAGIGSRSYEKAVSVWCAEDQQAAMTLAKQGGDPDPQQCDNPIAEQYELGIALGVTGTPALLLPNGALIPGYVPPDALLKRLETWAANEAAE